MERVFRIGGLPVALALATLAFGAPLLAAAKVTQWKVEVADPQSSGTYSSMRIDTDGNVHVAYLDEAQMTLKYSFWDHRIGKWFATSIDKSGGFCSLTLDSKQRPHISYLDYGTGKLKYAHWDGAAWQKQTIALAAKEVSFYTSITLGPDDYPSISFYEYFGAMGDNLIRLRVVSWNGSAWEVRTIDDAKGSGKFNSLATDSTGHTVIGYANVRYEDASLRFGRWNGQSWQLGFIEGEGRPGTSMWSVAMMLDPSDRPHLAYNDVYSGTIKYATQENGKWRTETVGTVVREGYPDRYGIALDDQGNPYISYYDAGIGVLKIAHRKDNKWFNEIVDEDHAGFTSSLQIHGGTVWVTYEDEVNKILKSARRPIDQTESEVDRGPEGSAAQISER